MKKNLKALEERIEDRTNRQLRKTIVISGIREQKGEETWADTKRVVANTISKHIKDVDYTEALDMLERVHRSAPTRNENKKGKRDIYAAIRDWEDCEFLTRSFRKLNAKKRDLRIHFNNKYGPMTTRRRNLALRKRRELLDSNEIHSAYIAFPAKLIIKKDSSADTKWVVFEDFSKTAMEDIPSD